MSRSLFASPEVGGSGRPSSLRCRPLLLLGALAVVLGGCPDPEAKFQEFIDNTDDDRDFMPPPPPDLPPSEADISGEFLLAASTVIAPDLPLQFIATNTINDDGMGNTTLSVCLQPLTLEQGKVTTPRQPIGDPLCFDDLLIKDGAFEIDAGVIMAPGEANPVTGGEIVASLLLKGTVVDEDFYCGTIEGEVMVPLMAELAGSTFAAVRLEDPAVLPVNVTKNCLGQTVTDP